MLLGFRTKTDKGRATRFVEQIGDGSKIHTLREDQHERWKEGVLIHFATGVRTSNFQQFKQGVCTGYQRVILSTDNVNIFIRVDNRLLTGAEVVRFYQNDGFATFAEFSDWFMPELKAAKLEGIEEKRYKLIHWTKFRY